jgi:TonB family protein
MRRRYHGAVSKAAPLTVALVLGCAGSPTRPPPPPVQGEVTITDCPTARAAENEQAAREGRPYRPIVQRGRLLSDLHAPRNRAQVTFDMIQAAQGAPLRVVVRIHVNTQGGVDEVQIAKGSGVPPFDRAVVEVMRTWRHRPYVIDCVPIPYVYPTTYEHRY